MARGGKEETELNGSECRSQKLHKMGMKERERERERERRAEWDGLV